MAQNQGKAFEARLKQDFLQLEDAVIDRLYDPVGGYRGISNVCDFIGYVYPYIYYLECKSTEQNTFSLVKLTQYNALLKKKNKKGVNAGVVIWFKKAQKIAYISIEEFERIKDLGYKSINVKMIGDTNFQVIEIPSRLKRTFLTSDYGILIERANIKLGEYNGENK